MPHPNAPARWNKEEFLEYQKTQVQYLKSRLVLSAALRNPEVARYSSLRDRSTEDAIAWLRNQIQASFEGELMTISLTGSEPKELVGLVNAVTDAYFNEVVNVERNMRTQRYATIRKLYDDYESALYKRRETYQRLTDLSGSPAMQDFQRDLLQDELRQIHRRLVDTRLDKAQAQAELELLPAEGNLEERSTLTRRLALLDRVEKDMAAYSDNLQKSLSRPRTTMDLESAKDEIDQTRRAAQRIGDELDRLKAELDAPPRIRLIEKAEVAEPLLAPA